MPVRAVIFDLWGTLVPIDPGPWRQTYERIAKALGVPADDFRREWSRASDERTTGTLAVSLRSACRALGVTVSEETIEQLLALRRSALQQSFVPRAEAESTLHELRRRGYLTALLTNCDSDVPGAWERSPLAALMDVEVFSCREGLMKPDPRIFLLVAEQLSVRACECLFIGDGASGELPGAEATGMRAVLLRAPDTSPPLGWTGATIASLSETIAQLDSTVSPEEREL